MRFSERKIIFYFSSLWFSHSNKWLSRGLFTIDWTMIFSVSLIHTVPCKASELNFPVKGKQSLLPQMITLSLSSFSVFGWYRRGRRICSLYHRSEWQSDRRWNTMIIYFFLYTAEHKGDKTVERGRLDCVVLFFHYVTVIYYRAKGSMKCICLTFFSPHNQASLSILRLEAMTGRLVVSSGKEIQKRFWTTRSKEALRES